MDTATKERKTDQWAIWGFAIAGGIAFLTVVSAYAIRFYREGISNNPEDWSRFGEYIGGVAGTLLALFTLVVLASTLLVQAAQLVDTRKELQRQSASIAKQNFENTFFRLLGLLEGRMERLIFPGYSLAGRLALDNLVSELNQKFSDARLTNESDEGAVLRAYRSWHKERLNSFDWYFQLFYQIMTAISDADVSGQEKQDYARTLWATLSPAEKYLLFYHGLTQLQRDPPPLTAANFGSLLKLYRLITPPEPANFAIPETRRRWYDVIPPAWGTAQAEAQRARLLH